ncbi:MAG: hypothetical protein SF097_26915 [Acidobacteriota bacterium]|nr:hypothetical protein [Acidobacteriota bacterium]
MDFGLIIVLLILTAYVGSLIYLNSKAKLTSNKYHDFPAKIAPFRRAMNIAGLSFYGFMLLVVLIVAVGVIFFRESFFPR